MTSNQPARLSLGPVLFNWPVDRWRDFYFRIADEAAVDVVVVGEIVCNKRAPFIAPALDEVIGRLSAAGKEVWLASPILVASNRERTAMHDLVDCTDFAIEANDMGALMLLEGRRHAVGPFINTYNEATLGWLARRGAVTVSLPAELPAESVEVLAKAGGETGLAVEVQVFGRAPLAISARCYHARAHGLHKDGCQFVCGNDPNGMPVRTMDGQPFLAVNGTQTMSHSYLCLAAELDRLQAMGVRQFRLSPHDLDMIRIIRTFRDVLEGKRDGRGTVKDLEAIIEGPVSNGFFHNAAGAVYVDAAD
ncbi:ubiquinone anaerobic biosynthesis protein UbiV [Azospirillum thermophilum]|uniref:Ubiquinone biosynthesis protein UbiV n=1 Tax=Azospirillum thermophilum TaxID=2202148 RepID=A0A2S2CW85_9PROT|nr:U32 family peptidase [Azospirillum thermophilum]AWK88675.1 U32 family peptidase [Azospirillum thermophilum]